MRPAGNPAKIRQTGGLRVTRVACLRHDAFEGLQMLIPTVEAFDRWYQSTVAPLSRTIGAHFSASARIIA